MRAFVISRVNWTHARPPVFDEDGVLDSGDAVSGVNDVPPDLCGALLVGETSGNVTPAYLC